MVKPRLQERYIDTGKVRVVFRHYAKLGENSVWAARASVCAHEKGQFWAYHDRVYGARGTNSPNPLGRESLIQYAEELGLEREAFAACMESQYALAVVQADMRLGQQQGVVGIPVFFINGRKLVGYQALNTFVDLIEAALRKQ